MAGIRVERDGALATLRLDKARGNAIDEALAGELVEVARALGADEDVRGVLLASAHPKLFCPGLDLVSLIEYDRAGLERFLTVFAEAVWSLYTLRKPVVAAIAGHAVAGGCVLALTADLRVLRRGGVQIGLNEVRVGVPLPWSVAVLLRNAVPPSAVSQVALLGRNYADEEALAIGLADALADGEGFEDACRARLLEFAERDPLALATTKGYLRADAVREMRAHEREHVGEFLASWFSAETQKRIRATVEGLSRKG